MRKLIKDAVCLFFASGRVYSLVLLCLYGGLPMAQAGQGDPLEAKQKGVASWYSIETCASNPNIGCPTASGWSLYELEKYNVPFAAMPEREHLGQWVRVKHKKKDVEVVILDVGPNKRLQRAIDLSKYTFAELAPLAKGVIDVEIEPVFSVADKVCVDDQKGGYEGYYVGVPSPLLLDRGLEAWRGIPLIVARGLDRVRWQVRSYVTRSSVKPCP